MIYPAHLGETTHVFRNGRRRRWRSTGAVNYHRDPSSQAEEKNPIEVIGQGDNLAARFFVGLNVGDVPTWTPKDVADIVWRERKRQGQNGSTSILSQLGIYESASGEKIEEPSVQVIVLDLAGTPEEKFLREMTEVGEALVRELKQESVILELQRSGIVQRVYTVTP